MASESIPTLDNGAALSGEEAVRIRFALFAITISIAISTVASLHPWGVSSAYVLTGLGATMVVGFIALRRDELLFRLLVLTMTVGCVELFADWYYVEVVPVLVYPREGPFVFGSPLYMPFSWGLLLWQLGLIVRFLDRHWGLAVATASAFVIGGLSFPYLEYIAKAAGWWHYVDVSGFGNALYGLFVAEGLLLGSLPVAFRLAERSGYLAAIGIGAAIGALYYPAVQLGFALFD